MPVVIAPVSAPIPKVPEERIHWHEIDPKTELLNFSTFFKSYHFDLRSDGKSFVEHHIETNHEELQCQYCYVKVIFIISMYTHILIISLFKQQHLQIHCQVLLLETSLFMYLLETSLFMHQKLKQCLIWVRGVLKIGGWFTFFVL